MVRLVLACLTIAAALSAAPARAADLATAWVGAVHAEPFVAYDFEPGVEIREYWLRPWDGRHYFPSGGKMPVLGRHERLSPKPVSEKRNFHREWHAFPVDTIEQPPLILNQQQYFPSSEAVRPPVLSK
jgi:hypothetical protein